MPFTLWGQMHIPVLDQDMGVDIVDFVKQLQSKGYVFIESNQDYGSESDCVYMSGSFLGFNDCRIVILQNKELKAVSEGQGTGMIRSLIKDSYQSGSGTCPSDPSKQLYH